MPIFGKFEYWGLKDPLEVRVRYETCSNICRPPVPAIFNLKNLPRSPWGAWEGQNMANFGHINGPWAEMDGVGNGPKLSALLGRLCKTRETNFLLKIRMCFWRCHLCMRCQEQLRPTLINSQGRVCLLPRRSSLLPTKESDSEIMTISIITDT